MFQTPAHRDNIPMHRDLKASPKLIQHFYMLDLQVPFGNQGCGKNLQVLRLVQGTTSKSLSRETPVSVRSLFPQKPRGKRL